MSQNNYEKVLIELSMLFTMQNTVISCRKVHYKNGCAIQYLGVAVENDKIVIGNGRWTGRQGVNFIKVNNKLFLRSNEGSSSAFWNRINEVYSTYENYKKECRIQRAERERINRSVVKIQSVWRAFKQRCS